MSTPSAPSTSERLFRAAVVIKGLDAGGQLLAGLALSFLPPAAITRLVHQVVTRDLIGAPSGRLAVQLETAAVHFADGGTRRFVILYLLLHGVLKFGLVVALWRRVVPAYPVAAVLLATFVGYELLRAAHTHSVVLPVFAAVDVVIIVLVIREYLRLRGAGARSVADPVGIRGKPGVGD